MARNGLFSKPENPALARAISLESPVDARKSVSKLSSMWEKAGSERRKTIVRAANLAANRAQAQLQRRNLSRDERRQFQEIEKIYRDWVDKHEMEERDEMRRNRSRLQPPSLDAVDRVGNGLAAPKVELGFNTDLDMKKKKNLF